LSTGNPPAGYYADPSIPGYIRYWDGTEWVAGTSRPAPQEVADQVLGSSQAGAAATGGGAHAGPAAEQAQSGDAWRPDASGAEGVAQPQAQQHRRPQAYSQQQASPAQAVPAQQQQQQQVPHQYAPQQQPSPAPDTSGTHAATPQQAPQQVPPQRAGEPASVAPQIPESVATMVVPSAFGSRTGTYSYAGANPFAGLPGSPADSVLVPGEESEVETTVVELATPGSRFLARIIDVGIAAVFSAPVTGALLLFAHRHDHQYVLKLDEQATTTYTTLGMDGLGIALWACALLTVIIVSIVLEGLRLGRDGQTYGKRLAGIRVVRMPDGVPLGRRGVGTRRTLLFWVLAVLPVIDIVALGGVLWGRPYRQGIHEKVTSTATIKV